MMGCFTDDHLRRLKEDGPGFEDTYAMMDALLRRLEAAEKVCEFCEDSANEFNNVVPLLDEWRKSKGEGK